MTDAVVLLSGGQDSTTCLGWAKNRYNDVYAVGFEYGQKHAIELECAKTVADILGFSFESFTIPALEQLADSALTTNGDVNVKHHRNTELPASFVPNRNALFLTIAHAYAQKKDCAHIVTGVCQTDYSGYPDCRGRFISALENTLNLGYETNIQIITPLMRLSKAEIFAMAQREDCLDTVIDYSHTCYNGSRDTKHDWGYGCGECPACELRCKGYLEYKSLIEA